jgi:transglutaminase-like putative cysteine protease
MRYQIYHQTIYTYSQSVVLQPHLLRLRPRSNGWQILHNFTLEVIPTPTGIAEIVDLDGNDCTQVWFTEPTEKLVIEVNSEIETLQDNPFNYMPEPWAIELPINYPSFLLEQLQPYLQFYGAASDPVLIQFAQEILQAVGGNTLDFLSTLNQRIYQECQYLTRDYGEPWHGGITWSQKRGSCRDFALLFMDVCRLMQLATRFVNNLMVDGKKSVAYKVFYDALEIVEKRKQQDEEKNALDLWKDALSNIMPHVEVRSSRIGGATFQIPMPNVTLGRKE